MTLPPRSRAGVGARWLVTGAALLTAALAFHLGGGGPASAGQSAPLNVVVVMTDDQRVSDMSVMSQTRQRIGKRGVTFQRSFATFPLCCPSRATYHTGLYAHNHGVTDNNPPDGGAGVFRDSGLIDDTTAVALQAFGYETALFGKYMNGYRVLANEDPRYVPPGYSRWGGIASGRLLHWEQLVGNRLVERGSKPGDYQTDVLARQAARFIGSSAELGAPFFLTVTPLAPHTETRFIEANRNPRPAKRHRDAFEDDPLQRPPAFNERDVSDKPTAVRKRPGLDQADRQRVRSRNNDRRASLLAVDDLVARLVEELKNAGELRDTMFIFTSDNGFLLGEHRVSGKNYAYDESVRVPLLVRGPGVPVRRKISAPVVNVDVPATIYDFVGAEPLLEQEGVSLLDVVAHPQGFRDRELLIETTNSVGVRTPDYLYVEHGTPANEFELYDLGVDPHQLRSKHAAPAYADVRLELASRVDELRDCEGDECN